MKNSSAVATTSAPEVKMEKPEVKVLPIVTDPREVKIQAIISIGRQIKKRSQLHEELAVVKNLQFEDTSKEKASISISDSGKGIFENENPQLVADLHEAAQQSLQRQINVINSQIDEFTALAA